MKYIKKIDTERLLLQNDKIAHTTLLHPGDDLKTYESDGKNIPSRIERWVGSWMQQFIFG